MHQGLKAASNGEQGHFSPNGCLFPADEGQRSYAQRNQCYEKTDLLALAIKAKDGATAHPEISLTQNTAAKIQADCSAAQSAEADFQAAVTAIVPLQENYLAAIGDAYTFAQRAKDALKPHCGNQHCDRWKAAGFVNNLAIPQSWDGVRVLVDSLATYFKANTAKEIGALQVTAARAGKLITALDNTRTAVSGARQAASAKREARDAAFTALRVRLRGRADELKQLIGREDTRWRAFGLNVPAEPAVPPQPEGLEVINDTPLQLLVRCEPVPYAERYRWWKKPSTSSAEPEAVGSSGLPMFVIENLNGGTHWDIFVSAVNASGTESPLSEPVQGDVLAEAA